MNCNPFGKSKAAEYLFNLLNEEDLYIRERIINKYRKYCQTINNCKKNNKEVRNIVHKYILEKTKENIINAKPIYCSLLRNIIITKSKNILKPQD